MRKLSILMYRTPSMNMTDQIHNDKHDEPKRALSQSDWLAHLEWLKELTYNYGHSEDCGGQCGPQGEGWIENDKCDCWHKDVWDFIKAND